MPTGYAGLKAYTGKWRTTRKQPRLLHHARPHPGVIRAALQLHVHPTWFNHPIISQDESVYRCLVCLGNTLHASHTQEEVIIHNLLEQFNQAGVQVRQLLQSMDACDLVSGCQSRGGKVSTAASEVLQMLKSGDNIDLD